MQALRNGIADLARYWRPALLFHALMQILGFALFAPLVGWLANRIIRASGELVITNYDLAKFALSPAGWLFILAVAALTTGILFAEFAGHSWIAGHAITGRKASAPDTVARVLGRLKDIILLATRVFLRLLLLALPFLAAAGAAWLLMLGDHDINYYLAENPPEWQRMKLLVLALVAGYALAAAWFLVRWAYALPLLMLEGSASGDALRRSSEMTRGRVPSILAPLAGWWLLLTAAAITLTFLSRFVSDALLDWAGIDVHRVLPLVALFLTISTVAAFLYGALQLAGHQFIVTRLYAGHGVTQRWALATAPAGGQPNAIRTSRLAWMAACALLAAVIGVGWFMASRLDLKEDVQITAHRGASAEAPENTLAALRRAIEAGATYAEIDVQHTRDGRIVLLHDADLMRMAGDPRRLAGLSLEELGGIDVGIRHQPSFPGERVPTLEQAIELVRDRMKLNIELKYNVPDESLAPAVIELLRREDFLDSAVITSLDYAALRQVRSLEPRLRIGHIVTASVGDVLRSEADFLSLNAAKAGSSLVRRAHAAGKQVHVWTVNDAEAMVRMIERGVDNIITDRPALLAEVMRRRNQLEPAEVLGLRLRVLFSRAPAELRDAQNVAPL
jgi:glycerophosphoryl diester phosphodiesterase